MTACLNSQLAFYQRHRSRAVSLLGHASIHYSSAPLGWKGVHIEVGSSNSHVAEELAVEGGHFIGMMLNDEPINIGALDGGDWQQVTMPSHSMWIHPEGRPFSSRHAQPAHWAVMIIDKTYLTNLVGAELDLNGGYVLTDPLLSSAMLNVVSLLCYEHDEVRTDLSLATSTINNLLSVLVATRGRRTGQSPRGGIAPRKLRHLLQWVNANIESRITVAEMAAEVDLSTAHFSREFKRATGQAPWTYVQDQRQKLAKQMLLEGSTLTDVASRLQYCDASHLARQVRNRHGVSLAQWLRCR